jgi:hypothetical protein
MGKHGRLGGLRWAGRGDGLEANVIRWFSVGYCACSEDPGYYPFPLKFLARIGLTDLSDGGPPDNACAEFEQLAVMASQAYSKLNEWHFDHCVGGRGRTGTILGAILRRFGYAAAEVVEFLDAAYRDAGRPGWPESPWQSHVIDRIKPAGLARSDSSAMP